MERCKTKWSGSCILLGKIFVTDYIANDGWHEEPVFRSIIWHRLCQQSKRNQGMPMHGISIVWFGIAVREISNSLFWKNTPSLKPTIGLTCLIVDVLILYPVCLKKILFLWIQSIIYIGTMQIAVVGEAYVRIFFSFPLLQLWFSDDAYFIRYFYIYHIVFFTLLGFFHKEFSSSLLAVKNLISVLVNKLYHKGRKLYVFLVSDSSSPMLLKYRGTKYEVRQALMFYLCIMP